MRKRILLLLAGVLLFSLAAVTSAVLHQVKRPMSDPETGLLRMSGALRVFLVDALWLRMNAHLSEGGVHPNDDGTNVITNADSTDQATADVLAIELKDDINLHVADALTGNAVELESP